MQAFHDSLKVRYLLKEYNMKFSVHCSMENSRLAWLLGLSFGWLLLPRQTLNTLMIVLFGFLHVADGLVTYLGLSFTNVDEANPILNYFAGQVGLGMAITLLKLTIMVVIAFVYFDRQSIKSRWGTAALAWADTFYSCVVTNNLILVMGS
jgi:hypothetical protein